MYQLYSNKIKKERKRRRVRIDIEENIFLEFSLKVVQIRKGSVYGMGFKERISPAIFMQINQNLSFQILVT